MKGMKHEGVPVDMKKFLIILSLGRVDGQPFDEKILEEVRLDLRIILKQSGAGDGLPETGDLVQQFEIRLIEALLHLCEDPDWYFCKWWASGVWVGSPARKLPRTPAVFDRKTKWRWAEPGDDLHGEWQCNYPSLAEHAATVQKQFEEDERKRWMCRTTVRKALEEYGDDLVIAATGAIAKKGKEGEVRVIYDGSHGVTTNPGIRVRDQVKYPTAQGPKAVRSGCAEEGGLRPSVHFDLSGAPMIKLSPVDKSSYTVTTKVEGKKVVSRVDFGAALKSQVISRALENNGQTYLVTNKLTVGKKVIEVKSVFRRTHE